MGIAQKNINFTERGVSHKDTIDSLQHIYDTLQMMDHVLDLQVDKAIHDSFQEQNKQVNNVMKRKSAIVRSSKQ